MVLLNPEGPVGNSQRCWENWGGGTRRDALGALLPWDAKTPWRGSGFPKLGRIGVQGPSRDALGTFLPWDTKPTWKDPIFPKFRDF